MISRVSSTNKEKQARRNNRTKKQRLNRKKKKRYKETENAVVACRHRARPNSATIA